MILGIDLGTTNAAAAYIENGKPVFIQTEKNNPLLPSVVHDEGECDFTIGEEAKKLYPLNPDSTVKSVKSLMGTNAKVNILDPITSETTEYSPVEISAKILKRIKDLAEKQTNKKISKAVITVPAYFGDRARKDTIEAGEIAGFQVERIINEPTAAALIYSTTKKATQGYIMIYDLGGGTFDTSIVEITGDIVEVIASDGNCALGGDDFDYALCRYLYQIIKEQKKDKKDIREMAILLSKAEEAKKALSQSVKHTIELENIDFKETIYREDFEKIIKDHIYKTINYCKSVMEKAKLKNTQIEKILLVGGSTRIPLVKELLELELDIPVSQEIDPDLAVVSGAAIQAAILEGKEVSSMLLDVASHSLCISCSMTDSEGKEVSNYCSKILKKNTPLPCSVEEVFYTMEDNQESVKVSIYQGESDFEEGNTLIEELKFDGLQKRKAGETEIIVKFLYNLDGTIEIEVKEDGTENKITHKLNIGSKSKEATQFTS